MTLALFFENSRTRPHCGSHSAQARNESFENEDFRKDFLFFFAAILFCHSQLLREEISYDQNTRIIEE